MRRPLIPRAGEKSCVRCTLALFTRTRRAAELERERVRVCRIEGDNWRGHSLVPQAFPQSAISCDTDQGGKTQVLMRQLHEFDSPIAALQLVAEAR
jgi:hypothetical protein